MSTQQISNAAVHCVGQYNEAAKTLVGAYRTGVSRLINAAGSRGATFLESRQVPMVTEGIKARLIASQEQANGLLLKGLEVGAERVVSLMDRVATGTVQGIESVGKLAERVESPAGVRLLQTLSELQLPAAKLSMTIADKVAEGAQKIEARVAAYKAEEAAEEAEGETKPARRVRVRKAD